MAYTTPEIITQIETLARQIIAESQTSGVDYGHPRVAELGQSILDSIKALADQVATLESGRRNAEDFLRMKGYRRCDMPACNCPFWHGGNANRRLDEIHDALQDAGVDINGATILDKVNAVIVERDHYKGKTTTQPIRKCAYSGTCRSVVEEGETICLRHRIRVNTDLKRAHEAGLVTVNDFKTIVPRALDCPNCEPHTNGKHSADCRAVREF